MKKILISIGPIYGKLDSVKIITNKFKGGLAALTAKKLAEKRPKDKITIVKCKETEFYKQGESEIKNLSIVNVEDFYEYEKFVLNNKFDAYILAAAVANLIPKSPYKGKFPSHNYKEEEIINIPFIIARRAINRVKKNFPRATLIGYKLFDGNEEELIKAGWKLLTESKANAVFCNTPETAKEKKICLLPDGAKIRMNFEEHISFINRIINLKWYKTNIVEKKKPKFRESKEFFDLLNKTAESYYPYYFGCVACKIGKGFYTTLRGKKEINKKLAYVYKVNHKYKIVFADKKASLNAPLLDIIFNATGAKVVVHAHKKIDFPALDYVFSGTSEEDDIRRKIIEMNVQGCNALNINHHGYYSWFSSFEEARNFLSGRNKALRKINWEDYNENFPERYLEKSMFDDIVINEIESLARKLKRKINVLEIGSNKLIRYYGNRFINKYYVFDPNVNVTDRRVEAIGEKEIKSKDFDFIIMRNSFNYLNKNEIKYLVKSARKNKALVLFNTFKFPTIMDRLYQSKASNGVESSRYDEKTGKITHTLSPKGKNFIIRHEFFYYPIKIIKQLFSPLKLLIKEKENTLYIKVYAAQ